jgi:hypothetical protein
VGPSMPTAPTRSKESQTTHGLRHAYASIFVALGEDPVSVMVQLGHTNPAFSLRVYTHMMRRDPDERERLRALVAGQASRVNGSRPRGRSMRSALRQPLPKLRLPVAPGPLVGLIARAGRLRRQIRTDDRMETVQAVI